MGGGGPPPPARVEFRMTQWNVLALGPLAAALLFLFGCGGRTNTYTIDAPAAHGGFERVVLARGELPADFSEALRKSFETRFSKQVARRGGPKVVPAEEADETTLTLQYRSPQFDTGSAAVRLGSAAGRIGTAAVGAFLPVGLVGEVGSGDIGLEATYLDGHGTVLARVLVSRQVSGALGSSGGTLEDIADELAKYTQAYFRKPIGNGDSPVLALNGSGEGAPEPAGMARPAAYALFAPMVGTWEDEVELTVPGSMPLRSKRRTVISWESAGGVLVQRSEVLDNGAAGSFLVVTAVESHTGTLRSWYFDSERGAVESGPLAVTPVAGGFQVRHEDRDRSTRTVVTFQNEGRTRETVITSWTKDRSRQLSTARITSRRMGESALAE